MSGQQIGTVVGGVVGAVIGFYAGGNVYAGWQIGAAAGGMIGGAVDPTKIYGPHVGDGQAQSATDGNPISWVMGTMWVAGTIVDVGQRVEVNVKQDSGKGSGTEQYTREAHQNFSILVCESDAIKGSTISSVLMVEQDGKIVVGLRPGSTILSDSQKWLARNCGFYYGDEAQLPISDDEASHGVGNAPAYRGVLRAFFTQFNVTAAGDRIPSFRFLVTTGPQLIVVNSGGDGYGDEHVIETGTATGWCTLQYATGGIPDKFQILIDGEVVADTGYHGDTTYQSALDTFLAGKGDPSETITQYPYPQGTSYPPGVNNADQWAATDKREEIVFHKTSSSSSITLKHWGMDGTGWVAGVMPPDSSGYTLAQIAQNICERGGLTDNQIDVSDLDNTMVIGYAISKQMNAVNALATLLGAHFAYASEYDGKLNFHFYGADAVMTIDEDDILAENDANNGNVTANLRNNATEFPKRITGQYYDPSQNYMPVTVTQTRRAAGVTATGDLSMDIPIAMHADQAQQTVDKALKIAYAQLEGTLEFSVPFAGKENVYLELVAGDPVIFRGKRWIVTEPIISSGYIKLTLQYDRQDAYTSTVQAIPGLDPTPPRSLYSGPTTLYAMNVPALRPQDTYGIYLAAASTTGSSNWRGCTVQVSYDGQVSWQNATTITQGSTLGTVTANEPTGGEPLTVDVDGTGDLESITADQIAAQMNAFALVNGNTTEIGQFQTATMQSDGTYQLTDVSRGLHSTTRADAFSGEQFTLLDSVYFLPVSPVFKGKTLYLRAIGFGESADDADIISIVYGALDPPDWSVVDAVSMSTAPTASVSDTDARISFRAAAASTVTIRYSTSADLSGAVTSPALGVSDGSDFTGDISISGLTANTTYYYTPSVNGTDQYTAPYPVFTTFPAAASPVSFSFAFGSCTRHLGFGADSIFAAVPSGVRFLMHIGDTIYADADGSPCSTLADYRGRHEEALAGANTYDAGWKALRAAHPVFTMWDDHELVNNFDGGTGNALYPPAKQAFQEYHGRANPNALTSGELYYTFQYGDVGFFVADLRSFRSTESTTDTSAKTILGATQKAALKDWLLTNKTALKLKFIVASVPAHGYASNTAGDSWGGEYDSTQAPNGANGYRTERNEIWDYIDSNEIPGVLFLSGDQHWAGSFKTTYASRPRYEFQSSPFNNDPLTAVSLTPDAVNGPVFWKYDSGNNVGVVTVDTTASPPTVAFQLYGPSGSLGSSYLTSINQDAIDLDLVPVPGITLTATLPAATVGTAYTGSITATNTGGATGAITLTDDALPAGLTIGTRTGSGDGPFTWPVTGTPTDDDYDGDVTEFSATNGTQTATLYHTWAVAAGALWTPANLATATALWLNDSSALTDDGTGHVASWGDVSNPSTLYFTPNISSVAPAINASGLNGLRTIQFDGVNDYLSGSSAVKSLTSSISAFSIYIVANPAKNSTSTGARLFVFSEVGASGFLLGIDPESSNLNAWQRRLSTDSIKGASIAHTTVAWRTHQSEHDYTGQTVTLRLDGGTPVTTNTSQGSGATTSGASLLAEMGGSSVSGSIALATSVAEVICLKYIPSSTDRQKIEGYLAWKWGIEANLPSGHPYKSAAPTT